MEFVPVVSTSSKHVRSIASDQQKNRALVTFSLFIRMACVSTAVKASMMDLVFVKSAVGALMATFAMEQYFMTAYILVLMHKKAQKGNICSACFTLWNKLLKFKRKVVKKTVIDEDRNATKFLLEIHLM